MLLRVSFMATYTRIVMGSSCQCARLSQTEVVLYLMKHLYSLSWIIFKKLLISKSIIESPMHIGLKKLPLSSLQKRRMWRISTMMGVIVMRRSKDLEKSYYIYCKNSVQIVLNRCQKRIHSNFDPAIQSSLSILNHELSSHSIKLQASSRWTL